ncbi:flagellar hook-associated protein FlgK [Massilia antarctica]|uniref:flagellar hook-associated protein FlgK n=1 Tax=Massilia antarctica TaxID=2765360 RepID=UPI0006BB594F|nr:flagellar hook-associated protein FlgK [Massilia sp. H27-R4]MCY0911379.1 flagellar hook-associated protein FlgK [Massilia sp. H27-R4]CUI05017.1 Flagellar hook-associated protein FlgK [Janthinobacterium sp. CG23_2]CUU28803.1 Flagellar hook-associated protein FlgK [Janthinobacterium sp. CG23_2]
MSGNLLNIGKSGLFAAQVGLSTAGHNIANANVAGYSRQTVIQASGTAQAFGYGFVGSGTEVEQIKRFSDPFLNGQVRSAQTQVSSLDAFYSQISQVDNLLSDATSGLSPALQDFFKGVQDMASNPSSAASRQAVLSNGESLVARFQGIDDRLTEIREGVNSEITAKVGVINSYAQQIGELNDKIAQLSTGTGNEPNDLMDARDQLIADLNKEVKTTVTRGNNNSMTVAIGTGQPLVVGNKAFELVATTSPTDLSRVQVGFVTGSKTTVLDDKVFTGGALGGLMEFRSGTLDRTQNSLGRVAIGLAQTFNAQHRLGLDAAGNPGGDFFKVGVPVVGRNINNAVGSTTDVQAAIVDPTALTQSDYKVSYDGNNYTVTRLSDNKPFPVSPFPQTTPQTIDGVAFTVTGSAAAGDSFLVRPTINGASDFAMMVNERSSIAAAAPISTSMPLSNKGTVTISEGNVDAAYLTPGNALTAPVNLTVGGAPASLSGFPPAQAVTVTTNGVATTYPAGTASIPFTAGANYNFGGVNLKFAGTPVAGDTFTVAPNSNGTADNRNARLLGNLQTKPILDGGKATYQSAYAELVSFVGNKTREVQVNGQAGDTLLKQVTAAQQDVSGVNLDEEATNLIKYQQAYQAAGKVMQMASTLFDTVLSIGR